MKAFSILLFLFFIFTLNSQESYDFIVYYNNKDYEKIISFYKKDNKITSLENGIVVCKSYIRLNSFQEDLSCTAKLEKSYTFSLGIFSLYSEIYFLTNKIDLSLENINKALRLNKIDENIINIYYYLGKIYITRGFYNKANIAFSSARQFFLLFKDKKNIILDNIINRILLKLGYIKEILKNIKDANIIYKLIIDNKCFKTDLVLENADYGYKRTLKELKNMNKEKNE